MARAAAALPLISGMAWARVGSMLSTRSTRMFFSSPVPRAWMSPRGIRASFSRPRFRIPARTAKVAAWDRAVEREWSPSRASQRRARRPQSQR